MLFSSLLTASTPPLFLTHCSIITSESVLTIYHITLHRSSLPLGLQIWSAKQFHWSFFASRYFSLLVFLCFCSLHCVCFSLTLLLTRSFNYHVPLSSRAFCPTTTYLKIDWLFILYLLTYGMKSLVSSPSFNFQTFLTSTKFRLLSFTFILKPHTYVMAT